MQGATKHCRTCNTTKGIGAFNRNCDSPDGYRSKCAECCKAHQRAWYQANIEQRRAASRAWNAEHKDRFYAYRDQWERDHPESRVERKAKRRQVVQRRVPWANLPAIRGVYAHARALRAQGQDVHVDHIVPLRSALVCGLHVFANLAIVPREVNQRKSNRRWPDMP